MHVIVDLWYLVTEGEKWKPVCQARKECYQTYVMKTWKILSFNTLTLYNIAVVQY